MSTPKIEWESIDGGCLRAKVIGGWLVKSEVPVTHNMTNEGRGMENGWDWRESMAFIPDPNHEW